MKSYKIIAIITLLMASVVTLAAPTKPSVAICMQHGIWSAGLIENHLAGVRYSPAIATTGPLIEGYDEWLIEVYMQSLAFEYGKSIAYIQRATGDERSGLIDHRASLISKICTDAIHYEDWR